MIFNKHHLTKSNITGGIADPCLDIPFWQRSQNQSVYMLCLGKLSIEVIDTNQLGCSLKKAGTRGDNGGSSYQQKARSDIQS